MLEDLCIRPILFANHYSLSKNEPVSPPACVFACVCCWFGHLLGTDWSRGQIGPSIHRGLWGAPRAASEPCLPAAHWCPPAATVYEIMSLHLGTVTWLYQASTASAHIPGPDQCGRRETRAARDILWLQNHRPDRERHLIGKRHHLGYFKALDLCCPLRGGPPVTGRQCQVILVAGLFLTVEQGHVRFGGTMKLYRQEGQP